MPESQNAENRVLLELLETAADIKAYDLVTETEIAQIEVQIEALCESASRPHKKRPVRGVVNLAVLN